MFRSLLFAAGGLVAMVVLAIFTLPTGQFVGAVVYIVLIVDFCAQEILNAINGHKK